jgi:hypothetical protein
MNRNAVLSAITNTPAGEVSWNAPFVLSLATYGLVPFITVISAEFPQVRSFLFSWVTPLLRALAKA